MDANPFKERNRLRAARAFSERISGREIARTKSPIPVREASEDSGPGWFEEFANGEFPSDFLETCKLGKDKLITLVRNVWEFECLVRALDSMETLSSLAGLSREYVSPAPNANTDLANMVANRESSTSREMWQHTSQEVRSAKACMQPVLKNWLLVTNEGRLIAICPWDSAG